MPWATPSTWSVGQLVNADKLNEQVRDNFAHLKIALNDDGKIVALSAAYVADLDGSNLTGVVRLAGDNDYTAGVHNFGGGAGTRFVLPVGADRWAT